MVSRRGFLSLPFLVLPMPKVHTWVITRRNGQYCAHCKQPFGESDIVRVWRTLSANALESICALDCPMKHLGWDYLALSKRYLK